MLTALALIDGGAAIVFVGVHFWRRPEHYYKYLHGTSMLAALNVRPSESTVKLGAALTVIIGLGVAVWGIGGFVS